MTDLAQNQPPTRRDGLADCRVRAGYTQEKLAELLNVGVKAISYWERGLRKPSPGIRPALAEVLGLTLDELDQIIENVSSPGAGPANLRGHAVPSWLNHLASLEQGAGTVHTFEPIVMPGLLQTEEYADVVVRSGPQQLSDHQVRSRVASRMTRQTVLDRAPDPLQLRAVIDQSVLLRVTGSERIMAQQLDHLLAMAERPNIHIQVLPLTDVAHPVAFGAVHLLTKQGESEPFMVCTENTSSVRFEEYPHIVADHVRLYEYLEAVALEPAESIGLIGNLRKGYPDP